MNTFFVVSKKCKELPQVARYTCQHCVVIGGDRTGRSHGRLIPWYTWLFPTLQPLRDDRNATPQTRARTHTPVPSCEWRIRRLCAIRTLISGRTQRHVNFLNRHRRWPKTYVILPSVDVDALTILKRLIQGKYYARARNRRIHSKRVSRVYCVLN